MTKPSADIDWHPSLWREAEGQANPKLAGDATADVTVIGAGFTGLRAAALLAEAGRDVVVLDAKDVGWGASGRSGGQVNPMLPFNAPDRVRALVGEDAFGRLARASLGSADALFALIERYQIRCEARQRGWLRVLHSAAAERKAAEDIRAWNAIGGEMEMIGPDETKRLSGSPRYKAGVVTARGGAIHPYKLVCGIADVARQAGARLFSHAPVTRLEQDGAHWRAHTPGGTVRSRQVIVATNGYTDRLVPGLAESIVPLTPIQIATDPLPKDVLDSILPQGHTISDSRRVIMYARREPDGRLVYGGLGRLRGGAFHGFDWLRRDAVRVFPQLAGTAWTHAWGGRIALTGDHLPHIHQPQEGLLVGLGYNGRGVAMSFVMGRTLAEAALGQTTLDLPISRITPFPWRRIKRFGMGAAISYMRLRDSFEFR